MFVFLFPNQTSPFVIQWEIIMNPTITQHTHVDLFTYIRQHHPLLRRSPHTSSETQRNFHLCAPMPSEFESRLVIEKGKKRMGILNWWQHGPGVDVRVDACTGPGKNPCGIKRNATQRGGIGTEAR